LGTTPIGAPLVGAIAQWTSPRVALLTGAVATVMAAGLLMWRHQAGLRNVEGPPGGEDLQRVGDETSVTAGDVVTGRLAHHSSRARAARRRPQGQVAKVDG
jgi:hypothetical protein